EVSPFELSLFVRDDKAALKATAHYRADLFDAETVARLLEHFERLLAAAVEDPDRPIGRLPMLAPAERVREVIAWNDTAADFAPERCLHELVEEQVLKTSDAVAVV